MWTSLLPYGSDGSQRLHYEAGVRRSWLFGQTCPVKVVFMAYRNTLQADPLKLVAKKLQSSLAVEGELPEDGLAAYGDDGDDLKMALARQVHKRGGGRRRDGGVGLRPSQGRHPAPIAMLFISRLVPTGAPRAS